MAIQKKNLERILVATDFSTTARAGLDWAVEIAKQHDAQIQLIHAFLVPSRATDFIPSPPDFTEELQAAASARLNEITEGLAETKVSVHSELRLGVPSQVIQEAAEELAVDLIVMGTRGLTGFKHLLLGSTAQRVVQHAQHPVLTVHPDDVDRHRRIRTVLIPTDFSRDARQAFEAAIRLLGQEHAGARIVLVHVYHLPYEYTAYGTIPTSIDYFKDVEGAAEERLASLSAEIASLGFEVQSFASEGYPPEVVIETAESVGADLIAMGTHGRTGLAHLVLGSTAERVVQRASCPVLTVRSHREA